MTNSGISQTDSFTSSAVLSDCGTYRYALWRSWTAPLDLGGRGTILFVMLNPSTADATSDDPTIRRCVYFAAREGFDRLAVGNLYAFRATNPRELRAADDPVGPLNDGWLRDLAGDADQVVAAWGATADRKRAEHVYSLMGRQLHCLGVTKAGFPRHPLYLPGGEPVVEFAR